MLLELSPDRATIRLPALTTAHSHAFQRAMRGTSQRRGLVNHEARPPEGRSGPNAGDDFWSWRGQMYRLAASLTPESIAASSRVAFRELARAGVHTVGEFHYIQHQPGGTPYADRTLLAKIVIQAAKDEGLRISLLRVAYNRAGPGRVAEAGQRRFCDPSVEAVLRDVEELRAFYMDDPDVRIGIAPHSVRAVPPTWLGPLAAYAAKHELPFHMHVAEQAREVEECIAETSRRPVELLAELGVLSPRFVAVHATHLEPHEAALLGKSGGYACICATTERDLGDGLPDLGSLRANEVKLCTGIDSHVITDPIDDLRSLETHERLRTRSRVTFQPANESPASQLWREGSIVGANACGFSDAGARVVIERSHPTLELVEDDDALLDAIVFSGGPSIVARTERG